MRVFRVVLCIAEGSRSMLAFDSIGLELLRAVFSSANVVMADAILDDAGIAAVLFCRVYCVAREGNFCP